MSVYKRDETWMVDVLWRHPNGREQRIRHAIPVTTKRDAQRYERELRQSLADGTYRGRDRDAEMPTLATFATEYLTAASVELAENTITNYRSALRTMLIPHLGRVKLDQITQRKIERMRGAALAQGLHPKTINNRVATLHSILTKAQEWGIIHDLPQIKPLKTPPAPTRFLTMEEVARLEAKIWSRWRPMLIVAVHTGLRLGELIGLDWDAVDIEREQLDVRRSWSVAGKKMKPPKSGKARVVPLNARARAALEGLEHREGPVFCGHKGQRGHHRNAEQALRKACAGAGMESVGWHALRHTFASHLVMRGAPLMVVQELLGHATIEMTMRYAHLTPDARVDAVRKLDE